MTRDPDLVGAISFPRDHIGAALTSVDEALSVFQAAPRKLPVPPNCLTGADRLIPDIPMK